MGTKLLVTAQPRMARIDVMDGWMQPKGSGYGRLDLAVAPGVYEVCADSGLGQTASRYCSVRDGQELPVHLQVPFFSCAPLADTIDYCENHARAASRLSNQPALGQRKPCRVMVFARVLHPESSVTPTLANLELRDSKRRIDNRWRKAEVNASEGWIGWCAGVNPGGYLLRWLPSMPLVPADAAVDQSLWLPEGFTLMIFLGIGKNSATPTREFLTLLQSPVGIGFNPFEPQATKNLWAMEMALAGWLGRRKFLQEDELETLLDEKHENPLLGIVAAHSLWLPQSPNWELLRTVHRHFQRRLRDHPDVQALEAHARGRGLWSRDSPPLPMPRMTWPPMFAASYRLARESDMAIDPDTLAGNVAGRLLDAPIWLCWSATHPKVAAAPQSLDPSRTTPNALKLQKEQDEILGTWLTGAMQSIAGLEYLGKNLEDELTNSKNGPRLARKIWQRFAKSRDPVLQRLESAIRAQFGLEWDRQSLGRFRLVSLSKMAARVEIPEEVVAARVLDALEPLDVRWPPRRPNEFLESPRVKKLLEDLVKEEAAARDTDFNLPRVFVGVLSWLQSELGRQACAEKTFASEDDFRKYVRRAVGKAIDLDLAGTLKRTGSTAPNLADS